MNLQWRVDGDGAIILAVYVEGNTVCSMLFHPVRTEMPRTNAEAATRIKQIFPHDLGARIGN